MTDDPGYTLVDQEDALGPLVEAVRGADTVALDTEADSLHHYHEKVCLLQISVQGTHWIVDPLAGLDLAPLLELLETRELIIHGLDYDLRLIHRAYGTRPTRVFDTMLAAQLLGRDQIGLAALVEAACGITLSKHGQRADWSRRPLPENLLAYAVDDTRYLHRLAETLRAELEERGRLDWHRESCARALASALTPRAEAREDAWRIKGGGHLVGRPAAVLRELWHWRDAIARRLDRPPFKVVNPEFLVQCAAWVADHPEATIETLPELPVWLRGDRLASFMETLERALALPESDWPGRPQRALGTRFSRADEAKLQKMIIVRDVLAAELVIQPGVLAPRDGLRMWIQQRAPTEEDFFNLSPLMSWQTKLLAPLAWPLLDRGGEKLDGE